MIANRGTSNDANSDSDPIVAHFLNVLTLVAGSLGLVIGFAVLTGWALDIGILKSIVPGLATMKPNTAVSFILASASLLSFTRTSSRSDNNFARNMRRVALILAALLLLVSLATLSEYLLQANLGIDQILFHDATARSDIYAGRMAPATACAFAFLAASLILLATDAGAAISQASATVTMMIGALALLGYLFNAKGLYEVGAFRSVAVHTASLFFILGLGTLVARHGQGWVKQLAMGTVSARTGRTLLVSVFIVIPLLGWVRLQGQYAHLYGTEFGLGLQVAATIILVTALILLDVKRANDAELRIRYLNRTYAVLSEINTLIVRVHDSGVLYEGSCRIAVDIGKFQFAWFGTVDRVARRVIPVAAAGDERGLLLNAEQRMSLDSLAEASVADAVLSGHPVVANDLSTDTSQPFHSQMLEQGVRSYAKLPIVLDGDVVGVFALYTSVHRFFSHDEMRLLIEMAGDIAFALDHMNKEKSLGYLAFFDQLTGVANAHLLRDRLRQQIADARRLGTKLAVALLDVRHFQMINDTFGRVAGDNVLKEIATRLTNAVNDAGRIARIGSNQFALIISGLLTDSDAVRAYEDVGRACFGKSFHVESEELLVSVRAGIALYPLDGPDEGRLLSNAEAALKSARSAGEDLAFYNPQSNAKVAETLRLETRLREAVRLDQFLLFYQPKLDIRTNRIDSVEALIRWQDPDEGLVSPAAFIPLLEETGLIREVGAWVLRKAVIDAAAMKISTGRTIRVAVNVSAVQLRQHDFVQVLKEMASESDLHEFLDLEITESIVMQDVEASIARLSEVVALGVRVAIDDFGTGYSSLAYLATLPVHALKIDRAFVAGLPHKNKSVSLVTSMISLSHSLGLKVIAEGVESEEQAACLRGLECDEFQGYLFGRPLSLQDLLKALAETPTPKG